jgi:2'-5' RNA ligase
MKKIFKSAVMVLSLLNWGPSANAQGRVPVSVSPSILQNYKMSFMSHTGPGAFDNALAMNMPYESVANVRHQVSRFLGFDLKTFRGWVSQGEAHVTVITPPEFASRLSKYLSIQRIEEIAEQNHIQNSDLQILGLGSGSASINGQMQSTYFLIVYSKNLLAIRQQIYHEYLKNGGPSNSWNPLHFFPHITIGFTLRDLHDQDGVIKDVSHSLDKRFSLYWRR